MSIQYTVLGFDLTTFGHESPPITIRTGLHSCCQYFTGIWGKEGLDILFVALIVLKNSIRWFRFLGLCWSVAWRRFDAKISRAVNGHLNSKFWTIPIALKYIFLNWANPGLFFFSFRLFNALDVNRSYKVCRWLGLWCLKRPLPTEPQPLPAALKCWSSVIILMTIQLL